MSEYLAGNQPNSEQLNQWIEFFHANGFLAIQNVLTPEKCELLRNDLDEALQRAEVENYRKSKRIMKQMFEHSQHNLDLFDLEPIVTFAEHLIGGANGDGYPMDAGIPNANTIHVIHNNSFKIPPQTDGLAKNSWHQDDTPHILSLDGKPLKNIRLNVLAFTVNYYLTDVLSEENGPTQVIPGSHLFGKFCDGDVSEYEDRIYSCLGGMGSAVCFNNQVWHRGSRNTSSVTRYITQITYAKRLVGHKYTPFMNYQMPSHCYEGANPRLKQLLGFLGGGAYG
ncbi:MAG TPA: mitomycin antibiotics/polyketide fumonisin biosynthesis protein [Cyanobacteria bacterium UBA11149]|nr:mitomycin antibiotics/polyketide fumonisin biosynthesis protein [Cyanobacteria bacterium UBA11367]HBE59717.1 mitomycin antibiotics/polyketide fumonisin biosynthesis protein [Cyanobacteria bacterium UBA11366]HBK62904.1 mitomycin antibiotics/polyketide fumonisin biosynthesis protein [Cyanobacteria bacterium UBA11166]HBR76073.1 mitomycin antibiotics/polyketide fumonisin biosynthesis protein [Cyanobacteria bacterium UBA11159]HBS72347.1 mitomycin antibiotics/polyketide fumonisin biosynthesis prot